jgi:hypothetical protein
MNKSSNFQTLFNRRPNTATIGLSIAAVSFFATILQGLMCLIAGENSFFFDFAVAVDPGNSGLSFKQAAIGSIWSVIGLIACYRALEPSNAARFTVLVTSGVKLFVFLSYSSQISLPVWKYVMMLVIAMAPIVLLLLRPSNHYYGRNQ